MENYSKDGPDDEMCLYLDKRMFKKYPMELVNSLGYESVHICIKNLISLGKTRSEIRELTGLSSNTVKNSAKRMLMDIKLEKIQGVSKEKNKRKKYKKKKSIGIDFDYREHKCSNPNCKKMTTNRMLCDDCYERNSEEVNYLDCCSC